VRACTSCRNAHCLSYRSLRLWVLCDGAHGQTSCIRTIRLTHTSLLFSVVPRTSRSFLLTLFFAMLGCTYGVGLLFWPFYEPFRAQVREHGLKWLYSNGTGLLDLPHPVSFLGMIVRREPIPTKVVVDIVYPLLLGIGAVMAAFLGTHLKLVAKAYTSLEYRVVLHQSYVDYFHRQNAKPDDRPAPDHKQEARNPFDQGWRQNFLQVLGSPLWLLFLPIPSKIFPPYVPCKNPDKKDV
jgi:hypothetical protein